MTKLLIPVVLIALVNVFSGCEKEFSDPGNSGTSLPVVVPNPVTSDTIFIKKYIETDSLSGMLPDTTLLMTFGYDVQKRLSYIHTTHTADSIASLADYDHLSFLYNGSDTLPAKSLRVVQQGDNPATYLFEKDTAYFVYDVMARLLADSTVHDRIQNSLHVYYYDANQYTFAANVSTDLNTESVGWNTSLNYWLDSNFSTGSNGNINTLRSARHNYPSLDPGEVLSFSFLYDTHPNPFFKIPALHAASPIFKYGKGPLYVLGSNNATSIMQQAPFGYGYTEAIIYEYDSNGYPSAFHSSFTEHISGAATHERLYKGVFVYGR